MYVQGICMYFWVLSHCPHFPYPPWSLPSGCQLLLASGGYWPAYLGCNYDGYKDCYPSYCYRRSLKLRVFKFSLLKGRINTQGGWRLEVTCLILFMALSIPRAFQVQRGRDAWNLATESGLGPVSTCIGPGFCVLWPNWVQGLRIVFQD